MVDFVCFSHQLVIELDGQALADLPDASRNELIGTMRASGALDPTVTVAFAAYARGSAFLRATLK